MAYSEDPRGDSDSALAAFVFSHSERRRTTDEQLALLLLYLQVRASHDVDTSYVTRATEQS